MAQIVTDTQTDRLVMKYTTSPKKCLNLEHSEISVFIRLTDDNTLTRGIVSDTDSVQPPHYLKTRITLRWNHTQTEQDYHALYEATSSRQKSTCLLSLSWNRMLYPNTDAATILTSSRQPICDKVAINRELIECDVLHARAHAFITPITNTRFIHRLNEIPCVGLSYRTVNIGQVMHQLQLYEKEGIIRLYDQTPINFMIQ